MIKIKLEHPAEIDGKEVPVYVIVGNGMSTIYRQDNDEIIAEISHSEMLKQIPAKTIIKFLAEMN